MASAGAVSRIRPAVVREIEPDALEALRRVEIARPFPGGDGEMNCVVLRRHAELLGTAPGDRAHVGVFLIVPFEHEPLGRVDLRDAETEFRNPGSAPSASAAPNVRCCENFPAVGAFALEHRARVMQTVRQHVILLSAVGMSFPSNQIRSGRWSKGTAIALPPWHGRPAPLPKFVRRDGPCARSSAFASGRDYRYCRICPIKAPSARGKPHVGDEPGAMCCDIALLAVSIKRKYVNSTDIIGRHMHSLTHQASRDRGASRRQRRREPYWDLIELLFFAYRDFVGDPDRGSRKTGFRPGASPRTAFRHAQSGHESRRAARRSENHQQSLGRVLKQLIDDGYVVQKSGSRRPPAASALCQPGGRCAGDEARGLQTERIGRVIDELGPGAREAARRFLAGMIDADERERVLRLIASADRPRPAASGTEFMTTQTANASPTTRRTCSSSTTIGAFARCCRVFWSRRISRNHGGNRARSERQARKPDFDLLVLDVMMPGENGFDFARAHPHRLRVPILMLTARDEKENRIKGLEIGADDYLAKPFEPRELSLRVASILQPRANRRRGGAGESVRFGVRLPSRPRRTAPRRGNHPPDRPRARDAAARLPTSVGETVPRQALAGNGDSVSDVPSTCRSTGCAAKSNTIPPIRCSCRPCAVSAIAWWRR